MSALPPVVVYTFEFPLSQRGRDIKGLVRQVVGERAFVEKVSPSGDLMRLGAWSPVDVSSCSFFVEIAPLDDPTGRFIADCLYESVRVRARRPHEEPAGYTTEGHVRWARSFCSGLSEELGGGTMMLNVA